MLIAALVQEQVVGLRKDLGVEIVGQTVGSDIDFHFCQHVTLLHDFDQRLA